MSELMSDNNSVSQNDAGSDAVLDLNVDVLNWRGKQSTSLCDRFRIHMFTEEFEQAEQAVKREEQENIDHIFENVMYQDEIGSDENEQIFASVMAVDTDVIIKADYTSESVKGFDFFAFFYILCGIAVAGGILWLIERRRKKK